MRPRLAAVEAEAPKPERSAPLSRHALVFGLATVAACGIVTAVVVDVAGHGAFPTHPASTGSTAYIVAIALAASLSAWGTGASRWPVRLVVGYWTVAATVLAGVYTIALRPVVLGAALTILIAVVGAASAFGALTWLERRLASAAVAPVQLLPALTPRENEVLALVAAGAANAGIAAKLFLSERTVEQHVRSIFIKLRLTDRDSSNLGVCAAVIWWDQQQGAVPSGGDIRPGGGDSGRSRAG